MTCFTVNASFVKVMSALKDGERGRLWTAMCNYALTGEDAELTGNERVLYPAAKMMIDACNETMQKHSSETEKHSSVLGEHSSFTANAQKHTLSKEKYIYSSNFESFWKMYPKDRQIDKKRAYVSWCKYNVDDALAKEICDGLERWKASEQWKDPQYIPHPSTFLNNKRWEIVPPAAKPKNAALSYKQTPISQSDFEAMTVDLTEV